MRIALSIVDGYGNQDYWLDAEYRGLCVSGIQKFFDLPTPHPKNLDVVFTKRPNECSVSIKPDNFHEDLDPWHDVLIDGVETTMYGAAEDYVEYAYCLGFRYAHLEY